MRHGVQKTHMRCTDAISAVVSALLFFSVFTDRALLFTEDPVAFASVPRTIHYQGKLTDPSGTPLTGDHTVTLRLYDAATGGVKLWEEQHELSLTRDDNGILSVILGSTTPFPSTMKFNDPLWLTIDVDAQGEFSPRQPLSAVSYAINADLLDGLDSTQLLAGVGAGDITGVAAGTGLTGGGPSGDVTLNVDVGTTANKIVQLDSAGALPAVSGANLTNLNASNLASGTVPDARLSSNVSLLGASIESSEVTDGTLTAADTAATFLTAGAGVTVTKSENSWTVASTGGGGSITGVTAGTGLTGGGTSGDVTLNVGAGTGVLVDADTVSVDVGTTANKIVQLDSAGALPAVSGANLTNLNASNLASGTVPDARLSSNVSLLGASIESSEVTDGTLTAADTAATFLTAGAGVTITKGAASWDISAVGSGGDITSVTAGNGLIGGATSGDATLDVGAGTGIVVAADAVSVDVGTTAGKIVQLDGTGALPAVSGANLASLNAASLASGTVPNARLSSSVSLLGPSIESSEVTDGTLTADDTSNSFLSAGAGITVTKAAGSWTVASTGGGGDITGVAAGTGLTGGGPSGDVTLALSTPVAVANGGTSASTAATARTNLGAAASGPNSDITSLGGLTTPLSVVQGGTGASTAGGARTNLINCMPIGGADDTSRTGTFQVATFANGATNNRNDHLWPVPVSGKMDTLRAFVVQAPGSGKSWTVTIRKNDANTTLTCSISGTNQSCAGSGPVSVAAGDRVGVEFVEGGSAAGTQGSGWSACFVPD